MRYIEDDAKVFRVFLGGGEDVITATAVPCSERLKTLGIPLPEQGYTENAWTRRRRFCSS